MSLKFENVKTSDAAELLEYLKKVGAESDNLTFGGEGLPFSVEQEEEFLKNKCESKLSTMVVARYNNKIIGVASLDVDEKERLKHRGELGISLLKEYWGNGIGTALMREIIKFALFNDIEIVYLNVRSDNERAIALYKKFDFIKTGTIPGYVKINGELIDCDIMCLKI